MPDRIVRTGILTSGAVNSLSWPAEVFYRRLFSVVDDFGLYDGRAPLLRAHLYPLKLDRVSESDVGKWLTECVNAGLVRLYPSKGQMFLQVLKFDQRMRAKSSKWPLPTDDGCCSTLTDADMRQQTTTDSAVFGDGVVFGDEHTATPVAESRFEQFWKAYPKKVGKDAALKAFSKRRPSAELTEEMIVAIMAQKRSEAWMKDGGQYIPHPSTWINEGRWQDEGVEAVESVKAVEAIRATNKQLSAQKFDPESVKAGLAKARAAGVIQ